AYSAYVVVKCYNSNGDFVAAQNDYTELTLIASGQRAPFRLTISNPPADIVRTELTVTARSESFSDYRPIAVVSHQVRNNNGPEVFGDVRNDQTASVRPPWIVVTFYDATGAVIGVDEDTAGESDLAPGATATYIVTTFAPSLVFDHYLVQAESYRVP